MPLKYDLHSHSTASDGSLAPADLVALAYSAGLQALALTDHDTLDGLAEAGERARQLGLQLVPGVEISVTWSSQVIHIVGLGFNPDHPELRQGLQTIQARRAERARIMGEKLEGLGLTGTWAGARSLAGPAGLVGRLHFARALVAGGYVRSEQQAFVQYLRPGRPGYVAGRWAELAEAVTWIRAAGGAAVLAHPRRYSLTQRKLNRLIQDFVALGGAALEVISGQSPADEIQVLRHLTNAAGLAASAGSDYHSPRTPGVALGTLPVLPRDCRPLWQDGILCHGEAA